MTPSQHLARITVQFPKFWKRYDGFRADRSRLGDWPQWCYCPLAGAYSLVSSGGSNRVSFGRAHLVGELGALAAWRPTKGIYRFDANLAAALTSTPLDRELPADVLLRLPEWCVWVDSVAGLPGFFAFLEHDAGDGRCELRLLLDEGDGLSQVIVHLGRGTLLDGLGAMALEAAAQHALATGRAVPTIPREQLAPAVALVAPFVSLLLYLCSEEPDLGSREPPQHPSRRSRATGAQGETVWQVGERVGAALRAAAVASNEAQGGTHDGPRPHVRRAHWHTYWTGPRDGQRSARARWLSPILVGAGETIATVHRVE